MWKKEKRSDPSTMGDTDKTPFEKRASNVEGEGKQFLQLLKGKGRVR